MSLWPSREEHATSPFMFCDLALVFLRLQLYNAGYRICAERFARYHAVRLPTTIFLVESERKVDAYARKNVHVKEGRDLDRRVQTQNISGSLQLGVNILTAQTKGMLRRFRCTQIFL